MGVSRKTLGTFDGEDVFVNIGTAPSDTIAAQAQDLDSEQIMNIGNNVIFAKCKHHRTMI
jgi:hypothetical protein